MSSVEARRATLDATEAIAEVLARAFDDDPLMNWIILDEGHRAEHLRTLFRVVSRYAYLEHDASWILEDGSGASVWRPPGIGQPDAISQIAELWPKITDTVRSGALGKLMEGRHPKEPDHYYLLAIGVDPALQGGGRGSTLIRTNLDICDTEGIPAYLENSKERNLPFYERHGFRVTEEHTLPNGGPPLWLMWREPRSSS